MQEKITQEQAFHLRRVELEAQEMSKEELIGALLDCWEARFQQKQIFQASSRAAGLMFRLDEEEPCYVLESEEDLQKIFGHEPTEEERQLPQASLGTCHNGVGHGRLFSTRKING